MCLCLSWVKLIMLNGSAGIAAGGKNATDLPADEKEEAVKIFQTTMWLGAQNGWYVGFMQ